MKLSASWLKSLFSPALSLSTEALCQQLIQAGMEVESSQKIAPDFKGVMVGEITKASPHPDADRLRICEVQVGEAAPLSIVCGAPNARSGIKVCVARVGAILPGDFKIKSAQLRGQLSEGMLCSEKELGLAETQDGILELPLDAPLGMDIRHYLDLDDEQIEITLSPNRPDCLSVYGIAREIAAINQLALPPLSISLPPVSSQKENLAIQLEAQDAAPLYCLQILRGVNNQVQTPAWIQKCLERSDIRSISLVVDVLNYVMLLTGQPLHAFDLQKIEGHLHLNFSKEEEEVMLLNGQVLKLKNGTLLIRDHKKILALAGIMGAESAVVEENTHEIAIEAAFFNPLNMAGQARTYGLHTDASHRFERGVDPAFTASALALASALVLEYAGGEASPPQTLKNEALLPEKKIIHLRFKKIKRLLGIEMEPTFIKGTLLALQCKIQDETEESLNITPPSFRFDLQIEEDLIEELGRIYGYDHIPAELPLMEMSIPHQEERIASPEKLAQLLLNLGFQEVLTYTFIDPDWQSQFTTEPAYRLKNPMSPELSSMRPFLLPSLLKTLQYNLNRQQNTLRFFEIGPRFKNEGHSEEVALAGVITAENFDFFQLKGLIENLYEAANLNLSDRTLQKETPLPSLSFIHPGQVIQTQDGFFGKIHPELAQKNDLPAHTFVFELNLECLKSGQLKPFQTISKFPKIQRDLAFIVDRHLPAGDIIEAIKSLACEFLQAINLFDVYEGPNLPAGQKSLAFSLSLQHPDRTLIDEEVSAYCNRIIETLGKQFQATLR